MNNLLVALISFIGLGLTFSLLEKQFYLHRQKVNRFQWQLDTIYYFTGYVINKFGIWLCLSLAILIKYQINPEISLNWITQQSLFFQLIEILILSELGYYFAHRLLHQIPFLWRFHAIHHSAEKMDWLTTTRVHPVDQLFTKFFQLVPLLCLDFSPKAMGIYFLWSSAIAFFIHANLRIKLPILRRIIVTPETHHWHHNRNRALSNTNFSAQLACIDWLFGTYYCPQTKHQDHYGISERLPNTYLKQVFYPFGKA
ncbi:fatty acid hydroxylase [[Leptolyngbya] sp. PCC 7376]|uniref:sterol desaturase family protein n=1 Tax=[Leptolyngbya] sp. PCC 7376 TaxID=111781 RepID=UPI00029F1AF5|nr:sterol desaturase family protein [[Leptolyngbya] sp. PCC 7376]AFY39078.1 fatty acid hydroxylase [[Leptolyngbya] sp. PCC 7376]